MRAERLTNAEDILGKTGGEAAVEPKLDGLRTQLHFKKTGISSEMDKVRIFSRGLENVTAMYPDLVAAAISELNEDEIILDGEAIGYDPKTGKFLPFQETVQRKRKYEVDLFSQNVPLRLVTFDCLYLNGQSLIDERYVERRKILEKIIGKGIVIVPADMEIISDAAFMEKMFEKQVAKGLEGIMAKKLDGTYQAGARGWNWIKLKGSYTEKLADTVDAVVMGIDFGKGKRSDFGVGAFLIGVFDPDTSTYKTISKVGTGLTDEEWRELKTKSEKLKSENKPTEYDTNKIMDCDVWIKPELVGEFKADELTKSPMHTAGFALRFPRLVRWREKKPEDSTSLKEISQLAKLQKKG
jgi:DNA ligase-1